MTYLKKAFGQNLRLIRKAKGLTQERLAELINLNQRQLTRIENGVSFVSSDVLEKLVIALNVDIKTLFDFKLEEVMLAKTGSDNLPHFKIIKNNKITILQRYNTESEKGKIEETIIEDAPDKYLSETAKKMNKPITAQHLKDGQVTKTYTYYPDGTVKLTKVQNDFDKEKVIESLLNKIKKVAENEKQLKYIELAIDSLFNKEARKNLALLINGMNLIE